MVEGSALYCMQFLFSQFVDFFWKYELSYLSTKAMKFSQVPSLLNWILFAKVRYWFSSYCGFLRKHEQINEDIGYLYF